MGRFALRDSAAVGIAMLVAVAVSFLTGLDYDLVRLRAQSPLGMALVDGTHVFAGVAGVPLLIAKVYLARRVPAGPRSVLTRWHRGLSTALGVLLLGVFATGVALVLPLPLPRESIAHAHLLLAVWAAVPAAWHAWHYGRKLRVALSPPRVVLAAGALALPAVIVLAAAQPLSLPAQLGTASWHSDGLPGTYLTSVSIAPDGTRVAAGDGLYVAAAGDTRWRKVGPPDLVLTLVLPAAGRPAFLGTTRGLYASPLLEGPYRRLSLPATQVRAVAADRSTPGLLYATSLDGVWRSTDGGGTWESLSAGLASPATAWALAEFGGHVFASDSTGVYRLDGSTWRSAWAEPRVLSLDVAGRPLRLYASSIGGGIGVFDGGAWRSAELTVGGHGAPHVSSVTGLPGGRLVAAAMGGGVLGSTDGGLSWAPFGGGLEPEVTRLTVAGPALLAATGSGVYRYPLPAATGADARWWAISAGLALAAGTVAAGLLSIRPSRGSRSAVAAAGAAPAETQRRRRWRKAPGESS